MELKVFDASMARKQKPGSPTVHISFKVGIFTFGRAALRLMDIKVGDQVKIGFNEITSEWFVWKVKDGGFKLREKKSKKTGSYGAIFNSAAIASEISFSTKFRGETAIVPIGSEAVNEGGPDYTDYWPIITAKLEMQKLNK